ncbi:MAG: hypothetical protein WAL91_01065, partial [Propionicimonas sp.]
LERTTAQAQLDLASRKEADLAELQTAHETATGQIAALLLETEAASAAYRANLEADALTWDERRQAALAEAQGIRDAAQAEADGILEAAKHEGDRLLQEATKDAARERSRIEAEVALLTGRRQAVVDQLGELANLVGVSVEQYGDGEPAT